MGAIADHSKTQVGTKKAEKATKRGLADIDEATELIAAALDQRAGDNGFDVEAVGRDWKEFVKNILVPQIRSGHTAMQPLLGELGELTGSKGDPTLTPAPHHGKPTQAQLLGEKLMKLFGDQADTVLNTLGHAVAADPTLVVGFLPQATARVKTGEPLVNIGGVYAFQADRDTEKTKRDYEKFFLDLVAYINGGAVPHGQPLSVYFRDAKKVIDDLNSAAVATPDESIYIDVLTKATGIRHASGEDFAKFAKRVVDQLNSTGSTIDESKFFKSIEDLTKLKHTDSRETFDKYVERVVLHINTEASKAAAGTPGDYIELLNAIGTTIGCKRISGQSDASYRKDVERRLGTVAANSSTYIELRTNLLKYCDKHGLTVDKDGPIQDILGVAYGHYASEATLAPTTVGSAKGWFNTAKIKMGL